MYCNVLLLKRLHKHRCIHDQLLSDGMCLLNLCLIKLRLCVSQCQSEKVRISQSSSVTSADAYSTIGTHRLANKVLIIPLLYNFASVLLNIRLQVTPLFCNPSILSEACVTCLSGKLLDFSELFQPISLCSLPYFHSSHNTLEMKCYSGRLIVCFGVLWCFVPYLSPFFNALSALQLHSHSSSLSSTELLSALDDVHRFSAQVLYEVDREQTPTAFHHRQRLWADCDYCLQGFTCIFCVDV